MIRRHKIMSAVAATIALAGCSGGDDDASPTPTPTSTPTPTPTASPTYVSFPLTAATEFITINAATSYTGDPAGAVTLGVAGTEMRSERVRLALQPTPSATPTTNVTVVRENTEEGRFDASDLQTPPSASVPEFVYRESTAPTTPGAFSQAEFLNNTIKDAVTSDAGLALTRVSYVNWWRGDSTAGTKRLTYSVFGYPTVLSDMPKTGTQAYASRVVGRLVSVAGGATSIVRVSGTVTVSVNFATGLVDVTLALTTLPPGGGAAVPYANISAQGAIAVGNNQFTGSFTSGSPLTGTIAGGFFGSQGENIGITFAGSGTLGGAEQRLIGEIIGKK